MLGLFFRICLPAFLFNFVADFSFCLIFMPTPVGHVFQICLFLQNNLASLLQPTVQIQWCSNVLARGLEMARAANSPVFGPSAEILKQSASNFF